MLEFVEDLELEERRDGAMAMALIWEEHASSETGGGEVHGVDWEVEVTGSGKENSGKARV